MNLHLPETKGEEELPSDFNLTRSEIKNQELVFNDLNGFEQALRDGFFLLKIPQLIDLSAGVKLCHNFYKPKDGGVDDAYKGFKEYNGVYFDREHFQTEHVLTEQAARERLFPPAAKQTADEMNNLSILVLRNVLKYVGVPEKYWDLVTGNCLYNQGTHWFACSHYRKEIDKQGCATHQNTGFVTILYIDQPGLEAKLGEKWYSISPAPGYFVVNFGRSFEILTEKSTKPVKSILHRVVKTQNSPGMPDRISMAAFTNMPTELNLYQFVDSTFSEPVIYQTVQAFLDEFNRMTWDDKHTDFGISS